MNPPTSQQPHTTATPDASDQPEPIVLKRSFRLNRGGVLGGLLGLAIVGGLYGLAQSSTETSGQSIRPLFMLVLLLGACGNKLGEKTTHTPAADRTDLDDEEEDDPVIGDQWRITETDAA